MARRWNVVFGVVACALCLSCGEEKPAATAKPVVVFGTDDPFDVPVAKLSADDFAGFATGDGLFDLPLLGGDGLGPLYTRVSCSSCHQDGMRGPGLVQKMVVVETDGWTPAADQSKLAFGHTVHPLVTAGATTPVVPPSDDPTIKVTTRIGPPILGRGYIEAVADDEILRMEAEEAQRTDGIHGRVNHVVYASQPNPDTRFQAHQPGDAVIGRFGLKARIATVDEFTADALQGDMGITSPLRPTEIPNPDGLTDDLKPGVDVTIDSVNNRSLYVRTTAIPKRVTGDPRGPALFDEIQCSACHVPSLKTRPDYPIAPLAGIDAFIYSDLLLHDMGVDRADGTSEGEATGRDWRTAPLIGLRFNKFGYMRDGIASTIHEAILAHAGEGSEAAGSVAAYQALSPADSALLLQFVSSL
ncbi:MAG TPA: di-heme oxidoredictase family protein [Polyangia bacterium]